MVYRQEDIPQTSEQSARTDILVSNKKKDQSRTVKEKKQEKGSVFALTYPQPTLFFLLLSDARPVGLNPSALLTKKQGNQSQS